CRRLYFCVCDGHRVAGSVARISTSPVCLSPKDITSSHFLVTRAFSASEALTSTDIVDLNEPSEISTVRTMRGSTSDVGTGVARLMVPPLPFPERQWRGRSVKPPGYRRHRRQPRGRQSQHPSSDTGLRLACA